MWKTKESKWKKLDNAAKIFPALAGREDAEVFRLTCQLKEEIDQAKLQQAVDAAVEDQRKDHTDYLGDWEGPPHVVHITGQA